MSGLRVTVRPGREPPRVSKWTDRVFYANGLAAARGEAKVEARPSWLLGPGWPPGPGSKPWLKVYIFVPVTMAYMWEDECSSGRAAPQ